MQNSINSSALVVFLITLNYPFGRRFFYVLMDCPRGSWCVRAHSVCPFEGGLLATMGWVCS
jgi:hypothetical protein